MEIDFYIKSKLHKDYDPDMLEITDDMAILISKIQTLIFTNKGEVLGDPNFGCDIPKLLWQTNLNATDIQNQIYEQIQTYISNISNYKYDVQFYLLPGTIQDIGLIEININNVTLSAAFK